MLAAYVQLVSSLSSFFRRDLIKDVPKFCVFAKCFHHNFVTLRRLRMTKSCVVL